MAILKGWKKTVDNIDGMHFYHINPISGMDVGTSVHIEYPSSAFTHDLKYHVKISTRRGLQEDNKFNKKSQALKFARNYMRTH